MTIFETPKIDCHCHVLDPDNFPYELNTAYRPTVQETGSAQYLQQVLKTYGVQHALLVGPNSGYGTDNRCLLSAIAKSAGVFKGIAVVNNDASRDELQALQAQGVVGVAFNYALNGLDFYADTHVLMQRLADLGMFVQIQVQAPQLADTKHGLKDRLLSTGAKLLIDHCGRPVINQGIMDAGFQALLSLGVNRQAIVKLSGFAKFVAAPDQLLNSSASYQAFLQDLIQAFGPEQCVWASDWPFLKAENRLDYGVLLKAFEQAVPGPKDQHTILWQTPKHLFSF